MGINKKLIGEVQSLRKEIRELNYDIKNVIALLFNDIDDDIDVEDSECQSECVLLYHKIETTNKGEEQI